MAARMGVIIVAGALGGRYLDQYLELEFSVFTLIFTLIAVTAAMYLMVKDLIR